MSSILSVSLYLLRIYFFILEFEWWYRILRSKLFLISILKPFLPFFLASSGADEKSDVHLSLISLSVIYLLGQEYHFYNFYNSSRQMFVLLNLVSMSLNFSFIFSFSFSLCAVFWNFISAHSFKASANLKINSHLVLIYKLNDSFSQMPILSSSYYCRMEFSPLSLMILLMSLIQSPFPFAHSSAS